MSNLRIAGMIVGVVGLIFTFLMFRGPKWKRWNFVSYSVMNLALILVCINPNVVNFARDVLSLRQNQHGRILALLIMSNLFLLFFSFYNRTKIDTLRFQMDKLTRNLSTGDLEKEVEVHGEIKPIMIVIPAYNEAKNLESLLPRLPGQIRGLRVGVLVVNDGSEDETVQVVHRFGHLAISNKINRGQGAASRIGYDVLTKHGAAIGVTMDADNQHRPEDLEIMVTPILEGRYDLVIGSRVLGQQERESWARHMGVGFFSWIITAVTGVRITDCSSGFKAFRIESLKKLNLTEDQFQSAEVLIEARKKGLEICEVPIAINRREHGVSKKGRDWSYGFNFTKTIIKAWWR